MQDIAYMSAAALAELVRRRELSPVEIADACIARIEARNPSLNALVFLGFDDARKVAKAAEAAGSTGSGSGGPPGMSGSGQGPPNPGGPAGPAGRSMSGGAGRGDAAQAEGGGDAAAGLDTRDRRRLHPPGIRGRNRSGRRCAARTALGETI